MSDENQENSFMEAKIRASIDSRKALEPLLEKSPSLEYTQTIIVQQGNFLLNLAKEIDKFIVVKAHISLGNRRN